jgi:hypothetical protein
MLQRTWKADPAIGRHVPRRRFRRGVSGGPLSAGLL